MSETIALYMVSPDGLTVVSDSYNLVEENKRYYQVTYNPNIGIPIKIDTRLVDTMERGYSFNPVATSERKAWELYAMVKDGELQRLLENACDAAKAIEFARDQVEACRS